MCNALQRHTLSLISVGIVLAHASPDMRKRLAQSALEPAPNTPEEFRKMVASEVQRWTRVIKDAGIREE